MNQTAPARIEDEEKKRKIKGGIMSFMAARTEIARVKTAYSLMKELGITGCRGIEKVEVHRKSPMELELRIQCRIFNVIINYDIAQDSVTWLLELKQF